MPSSTCSATIGGASWRAAPGQRLGEGIGKVDHERERAEVVQEAASVGHAVVEAARLGERLRAERGRERMAPAAVEVEADAGPGIELGHHRGSRHRIRQGLQPEDLHRVAQCDDAAADAVER